MRLIKFSITIFLFFLCYINFSYLFADEQETYNYREKKDILLLSIITNSSKRELKKFCKYLQINDRGSRRILIKRIKSFLQLKSIKKNESSISNRGVSKSTIDSNERIIIENADEGEYLKVDNSDEEILSASGNVYLRYKNILMRANELRLNVKTRDMICKGNVILWDGKKEITGEKIFYNLDSKNGIIYNGKSKIGKVVYSGSIIKKIEKGPYIIEEGRFTSCKASRPHYYIEASKIWVYPDDKIVLFNAYYIVSGVKLFWIPLYFRFEKGTGIITSWGKRKIDGWYMQNTYITHLAKNDKMRIKFDHYQKRGEYAGIDYRIKNKIYDVISSISGAYDKKIFGDSNINPATGKEEREYRGKVSFKGKYTFQEDKENKSRNTTVRVNFFKQSDYGFIRDFEMMRSTKPGFHYYNEPIYNNDIYNQNEHSWYINLNDSRKNSTFIIKANWDFRWNSVNERYELNTATTPFISYSLNGSLFENLLSKSNRNAFFNPKINYRVLLSFQHQDYYNNGSYLKSVDKRVINGALSKVFNIYNICRYSLSLSSGDIYYLPYNVSENEKNNYIRESYSYGGVNDTLQLGVSSFYFRITHNYKWRFKKYSENDVYGNVVSHNLGFYLRNSIIRGVNFYASTSYDLRLPVNEKFTGFQKDRFSNLDTGASLSLFKNLSFNERYVYSIRNSQPLSSNLTLNYIINNFQIPLIKKINYISFNTAWNHNFPNPVSSKLSFNFNLSLIISRYWSLRISTHSENNKLYLYSPSLAEKYGNSTLQYRSFFTDLLNSINIFQYDKMKESYFKLKRASIILNHDLHCWQMSLGYTLQQRYFYYGSVTQYPYFEHSIFFKINMKLENKLGIDEHIRTKPPTVIEY